MEILFRTRKLERQFTKSAEATKAFGQEVGHRYIQRLNIMAAARDLEEVMALPGLRCHELSGNRKGQYAVNLTGFYRLIFTMVGDRIDVIRIEEVSKHYGD